MIDSRTKVFIIDTYSYFFCSLEGSFFMRDFFPPRALSRNSSSMALFTVFVIIFFSLCASCNFVFLGCTGASINQIEHNIILVFISFFYIGIRFRNFNILIICYLLTSTSLNTRAFLLFIRLCFYLLWQFSFNFELSLCHLLCLMSPYSL